MHLTPSDFIKDSGPQFLISIGESPRKERLNACLLPGHLMQRKLLSSLEDRRVEYDDIPLAHTVQPSSLDLNLSWFMNLDGRPRQLPFDVQPGESIVGVSGMMYNVHPRTILGVETRSWAARCGLVAHGFWKDGITSPFLRGLGELTFLLRNHESDPLHISGPFSPVQISQTFETHETPKWGSVRLYEGDRDVTEENTVYIGGKRMFVTHLDEMAAFKPRQGRPIDLLARETADLLEHVPVQELPRDSLFSLTFTRERVVTEDRTGYMLPFHYTDIFPSKYWVNEPKKYARRFQRAFAGENGMPVTGNAGLINPGTRGGVVCENLMAGKEFERYFAVGQPFALVVPIPFIDGMNSEEVY